MIVLELFGAYLALAGLFYLGLTASAVDTAAQGQSHRLHWQRARSIKNQALRRLRPLMTLRFPKRPR